MHHCREVFWEQQLQGSWETQKSNFEDHCVNLCAHSNISAVSYAEVNTAGHNMFAL